MAAVPLVVLRPERDQIAVDVGDRARRPAILGRAVDLPELAQLYAQEDLDQLLARAADDLVDDPLGGARGLMLGEELLDELLARIREQRLAGLGVGRLARVIGNLLRQLLGGLGQHAAKLLLSQLRPAGLIPFAHRCHKIPSKRNHSLQRRRWRLGPRYRDRPPRLIDRLRAVGIVLLRRRISRRLRLAGLLYLIISPSAPFGGHWQEPRFPSLTLDCRSPGYCTIRRRLPTQSGERLFPTPTRPLLCSRPEREGGSSCDSAERSRSSSVPGRAPARGSATAAPPR